MRCPNCGFDNPDGFKFCGECGTSLKNLCPSCGFENPPNFKFCGQCGTKLVKEEAPKQTAPEPKVSQKLERKKLEKEFAEVERESERRPVSVLFADISGFTTLSEKLDPEELRAFIGDILNNLAKIVKKNGGYVDKFIGDEVMALFGAPRALGDDTKRAVKTAYEMIDFIRKNYTDISIHGGIATGEVVVGSISDRAQDYTAMGDTVNIAKRLEEESSAWQFLVDEYTHILTSSYFEYKYFGDIKLKGKTKTIKVYELVGERKKTVFIGRERELSDVIKLLDSGYKFIGISGEPGVGISSFTEMLQQKIKNSFRFVASDHGFFGIVRDIIQYFSGISDEKDSVLNLAERYGVSPHFLGYVFGIVFPQSPIRYMSADKIEQETQRNLLELMNKMLEGKILIIDSFSEADRQTKSFFLSLPDFPTSFSVIVGFDKGGIDLDEKWKVIELSNFNREETKDFVSHLCGEGFEPDETLVDAIFSITGGNPLFISELYNLLVSSDSLNFEDGKVKLKEGVVIPKAIGIKQVILSKIDKLPPKARYVLEIMSCLSFPSKKVLHKFFEENLGEFHEYVELLKRNGFIEEGEDGYLFKQAIYKDIVYDKLLKSRKYEIHSKFCDLLCESSVFQNDIDIMVIAAEQAERSERFWDAFVMYSKAGRLARSKYNIPQAIQFFEKAYRIFENITEYQNFHEVWQFFVDFGELMYHIGDFERAIKYFDESEKFATEKREIIKSRISKGDSLQMIGKFDEAEKIYKDIVEQIEGDISFKPEYVKTLALLCHLYVDKGKPQGGIKFGLRALEVSDETFKNTYIEIYADVVNALGRAYLSVGDFYKAKKYFMEFYEVSTKTDNQRLKGVAMSNYAVSLYYSGEFESALLFFRQYLEVSKSIMDVRGTAIALVNISQVLFEMGKIEEALQNILEALSMFRKIGDRYGIMETLEGIATMKILIGNYDEGKNIVLQELLGKTDSEMKNARYNLLLAMASVGQKNFDEAKEYFEKASFVKDDIFYSIVYSMLKLHEGDFESAYEVSLDLTKRELRDSEKIYAILNFLKVISAIGVDAAIFQDEKERCENELKKILKKYPDFEISSLKFFV